MRRFALRTAVALLCLFVVTNCGMGGSEPTGPTVVGLETELTYVIDDDARSPVAGYLVDRSMNAVAPLARKDGAGNPVEITGGHYRKSNGAEWTVLLGDDGMPEFLVADDYVFRFRNYGTSSVDVEFIRGSTTNTMYDVHVDSYYLSRMRSLAGQSYVGSFKPALEGVVPLAVMGSQKFGIGDLLEVASVAISVGTCAVSLAAAAGITTATGFAATPIGVALGYAGCAGAAIGVYNLFADAPFLAGGSTAISGVQCIAGQGWGCASFVTGVMGSTAQDIATAHSVPDSQDGGLDDVRVDTRYVTIRVWDHATIDGDQIDVIVNGSYVLRNHVLSGYPGTSVDVTLRSGNNTVVVHADNEGQYSPNTATIRISDVTAGAPEQDWSINQGQDESFRILAP